MKRTVCAGLASLACACMTPQSPGGVTDGVHIVADPGELAGRVTYVDKPIAVRPIDGRRTAAAAAEDPRTPALTLVAEVAPPTVRGSAPQPDGTIDYVELPLQATHVAIRGTKAIVSYHQIGSVYAGAVDVFDITDPRTPRLISHAAFELADANSVAVGSDAVYVAGSTWNPAAAPFSAIVDRFELTPEGLSSAGARRWGMVGHVATGVDVDGDQVYASSGAAGEVAVLSDDDSVRTDTGLTRWIAADDGVVVALIGGDDGGSAIVRVLDGTSLATVRDIAIPGADGVDAKNALDVVGSRAYVAAGQTGLHVVDLDTGELLQQRTLPTDSGFAPEDVATNSVSRDDDLVFTANGALGAWVAQAGRDGRVDTLGALELGSSANHVAYSAGWLVVAGGTRGLQILRVATPEPEPTGWLTYLSAETGVVELWAVSDDGSRRVRLTDGLHNRAEPVWKHNPSFHKYSWDGERIVVSTKKQPDGSFGPSQYLWVLDADGSNFRPLTNDGGAFGSGFGWDGDSRHVVYNYSAPVCSDDVRRIDAITPGAAPTTIRNTGAIQASPAPNPADPNDVWLWNQSCGRVGELRRLDVASQTLTRVAAIAEGDGSFGSFNADGTRYAFSPRLARHQVFYYDLVANEAVLAFESTDPSIGFGYPVFGNGDTRMYALSCVGTSCDIYAVDLASNTKTPLGVPTIWGGAIGGNWAAVPYDIDVDRDGLANGIDPD